MLSSRFVPIFFALIAPAFSATIDVVVGGPGKLVFTPEFVTARPGDIVRFTFQQKNHTVTQSSLESPCTPAPSGFDSNFVPVGDDVTSNFPTAQFTVRDSAPVWTYCRQGNHCRQGMVFAINPGDKFAAFKAAATGQAAPPAASGASGVVTVTQTITLSGQAQTTTYTSAKPSATSALKDHRVVVGGPGKLVYEPSNISAAVGDTVTFEFRQKNHTATQSTFANPCRALALTSTTGQVGFDSGFIPVADGTSTFPTYTITINDTKPIWAYCRQGNHCGQGMVFSVNAVENGPESFSAFKSKAIQLNGTSQTNNNNNNSSAVQLFNARGAGTMIALVSIAAIFL